MDAKLKHLEFIETTIGRMATNSFLFKGWAITIATALAAFAAANTKAALLTIAIVGTALFWGLDGYYLWLERRFIELYEKVAARDPNDIDFKMSIDRTKAGRNWLKTCKRPHLCAFYGSILAVELVAIYVIRSK